MTRCPICGSKRVRYVGPDKHKTIPGKRYQYLPELVYRCESCKTRYDKEGLKTGVGMY